jgi:excisionase family DNA binding protein
VPKKSAVPSTEPRRLNLKAPSTPSEISPGAKLLDVKAAATYLSCHVWLVRTLAWEGRVPFLRLGHKILFDRADLDTFIAAQKTAVAR